MSNGRRRERERGLWRARDGASAVEFALLAAFLLVPLLLGVLDLGMTLQAQMELSNAVDAGAQYVLQNGGSGTSSVNSAIGNATSLQACSGSASSSCLRPLATLPAQLQSTCTTSTNFSCSFCACPSANTISGPGTIYNNTAANSADTYASGCGATCPAGDNAISSKSVKYTFVGARYKQPMIFPWPGTTPMTSLMLKTQEYVAN